MLKDLIQENLWSASVGLSNAGRLSCYPTSRVMTLDISADNAVFKYIIKKI